MPQLKPLSPLTLISLFYLLALLPCTTTAQQSSIISTKTSSITTTTTTTSTTAPTSTPSSSSPPPLEIEDGSGTIYQYAGCWNESAGLPGTTGLRALTGSSEVLPGEMTVGLCLGFCAHGGSGGSGTETYRFAGLEYSRECWCGDKLNVLAVRLPDSYCDTPCDGANTTACGGALRLTLYNATSLPAPDEAGGAGARIIRRGEGARAAVVAGMVGLVLSLALGGL